MAVRVSSLASNHQLAPTVEPGRLTSVLRGGQEPTDPAPEALIRQGGGRNWKELPFYMWRNTSQHFGSVSAIRQLKLTGSGYNLHNSF
jgi:hypothetical protein